jgi:hypothetical protein
MVAVAVHEDLVRPGVMAVIEDLVTEAESGVLEIDGDPAGRVYLEGGQITYARASWVPGLAARLRAIAPSLDEGDSPPNEVAEDTGDVAIARLVVRHGYLTEAGLQELIESIVVDAFLVLTIPLAGDSPVAATHFTPTRTRSSELFPRLTLDVVRAEAVRRAEEMADFGLAPTTTVAPRDLAASVTVLTREQWAVACLIGDRVSARELAMRRGASLSDTVHCLGSLVNAGLCAPVHGSVRGRAALPPVPPQAGSPQSGPMQAVVPQAVVPQAVLPQPGPPQAVPPRVRHDGRVALPPVPRQAVPPQVRRVPGGALERSRSHRLASSYEPPSMDLLRQVLSGLRQL